MVVHQRKKNAPRESFMFSIRESKFIVDSFVEDEDEDAEHDHIHGSGGEGDGGSKNGGNDAAENTVLKNATKKETRRVRIWRYLVIIMLLCAGATTSALTYSLLHSEEEDDFETSVSRNFLGVVDFKDDSDDAMFDVELPLDSLILSLSLYISPDPQCAALNALFNTSTHNDGTVHIVCRDHSRRFHVAISRNPIDLCWFGGYHYRSRRHGGQPIPLCHGAHV